MQVFLCADANLAQVTVVAHPFLQAYPSFRFEAVRKQKAFDASSAANYRKRQKE